MAEVESYLSNIEKGIESLVKNQENIIKLLNIICDNQDKIEEICKIGMDIKYSPRGLYKEKG